MIDFKYIFKNKKFINYTICIITILLWIYLTLTNSNFSSNFNTDEIHAWDIASTFGFLDIIKLMRVEGHTCLWYFFLKPFTYFPDLFFPWIIKTLSWLFSFIALILFWTKSKINIFIKFLFTISFPILSLYPILGRSYSLCMLSMFIVAILYKNRIQKPILYAFAIFFAANTDFMGAIGVFGFGLLFLYEIFKSNTVKKNIIPIIILFLIPISLLIQWINFIVPVYVDSFIANKFKIFGVEFNFISLNISELTLFLLIFGFFTIIIYMLNSKKMLFYLGITYFLMLITYLHVYNLGQHHLFLIIIELFIAYWITLDIEPDKKHSTTIINKKLSPSILIQIYLVITCIALFPKFVVNDFWFSNLSFYKDLAICIADDLPDDSTIYMRAFSFQNLPYINKIYKYKNFKLKTLYGTDINSYDAYYNSYTVKGFINSHIDYLKEIKEKNSYLLIITTHLAYEDFEKAFSKRPNKLCEKYFKRYKLN